MVDKLFLKFFFEQKIAQKTTQNIPPLACALLWKKLADRDFFLTSSTLVDNLWKTLVDNFLARRLHRRFRRFSPSDQLVLIDRPFGP
jgi:hypothetical protein